MDLMKGCEPVTKEMLLKNLFENLVKFINEKHTPIPKFFTGNEEERVQWVKDVIHESIELHWHIFDADHNGDLDEEECFRLI
jgi:hypothetical protein